MVYTTTGGRRQIYPRRGLFLKGFAVDMAMFLIYFTTFFNGV
jgi:hypothetical protein